MSELDLDAMEKLEKAATPGPWDADIGYISAQVPGGRPNGEGIAIFERYTRSKATNPKADAAFSAAARSFVPLAIERIRELEKQRDDLQAANTAEVERRRKAEAALEVIAKGKSHKVGNRVYLTPGQAFAEDALRESPEEKAT